MSNPFENSQQNSVENEARKTMDSSWDSPFHTLGKGATQAAPGNHNHPENLTSDKVIAGNNMTIQKNADGSVTISSTLPGTAETLHGSLAGRDLTDQHPISAITNLQTTLNNKSDTSHGHSDYSLSGHNHSGVYAPASHGHAAGQLRVFSHDMGNFAGYETKNVLFGRSGGELPISVYSVYNAVNYSWGIGLPDAGSFRLYMRNQSSSSNNIGVVYIIMGKMSY